MAHGASTKCEYQTRERSTGSIMPFSAGASFKPQHAGDVLHGTGAGAASWFEVHPENYMVDGGERLAVLEALRRDYPVSLHGVALSLGGAEPLDGEHLRRLRRLIDRIQPDLISEHIAWSSWDGTYFADLLPAPLHTEALNMLCDNIDQAQDALGRRILIENPSHYLTLPGAEMAEPAFLEAAARRTGCGLLVDVNNVYVSAVNIGVDAEAYLDALPGNAIEEIHLAGHAADSGASTPLLIDNHGDIVADPVWRLYERLIGRIGPRPTLLEWDTDVPDWATLEAECGKAEARIDRLRLRGAA